MKLGGNELILSILRAVTGGQGSENELIRHLNPRQSSTPVRRFQLVSQRG
jgi:hypothetical protein